MTDTERIARLENAVVQLAVALEDSLKHRHTSALHGVERVRELFEVAP